MKKIEKLILCAHPDDLIFCYGMLDKYTHVIFFTNEKYDDLSQLNNERHLINHETNTPNDNIISYNFPDQQLSEEYPLIHFTTIIDKYLARFENIKTLIIPNPQCLNADHRRIAEAGLISGRPCSQIETIITYETVGSGTWTHGLYDSFQANYYLPISWDFKQNFINTIWPRKMQDKFHPFSFRGLKNIAINNGLACNEEYAEGYKIIRTKFINK